MKERLASVDSSGSPLKQHSQVLCKPKKQMERVRNGARYFRNPPQPHMCIHDFIEGDNQPCYINVLSWVKILTPRRPEDPIPLYGGMRIPQNTTSSANNKKAPKSQPVIFAVMANPEILKMSGKTAADPADREALVELMLDFVEAMNPDLKFKREFTILSDRDLAGELKDIWMAVHIKRERERQEGGRKDSERCREEAHWQETNADKSLGANREVDKVTLTVEQQFTNVRSVNNCEINISGESYSQLELSVEKNSVPSTECPSSDTKKKDIIESTGNISMLGTDYVNIGIKSNENVKYSDKSASASKEDLCISNINYDNKTAKCGNLPDKYQIMEMDQQSFNMNKCCQLSSNHEIKYNTNNDTQTIICDGSSSNSADQFTNTCDNVKEINNAISVGSCKIESSHVSENVIEVQKVSQSDTKLHKTCGISESSNVSEKSIDGKISRSNASSVPL